MNCPRCGSPLERYSLGDRTAATCGNCGYAGVPVDHHGETRSAETWAEALSRVPETREIASVTVETSPESPSLSIVLEATPEEDTADPEPTTVRVTRPDSALVAALEAASGEDRFVCDICGQVFDEQTQLYGHLSVHSEKS